MFSSLIAPVLLAYQTRSVFHVIRGADGGWPAQVRGDGSLRFGDAWAASHWIVTSGAVLMGATQWLSPVLVPWLLPVTLPMIFAPLIIAWSSKPTRSGLFLTPAERQTPAVAARQALILSRWQGMEDAVEPGAAPGPAVRHA